MAAEGIDRRYIYAEGKLLLIDLRMYLDCALYIYTETADLSSLLPQVDTRTLGIIQLASLACTSQAIGTMIL